MSEPMFLPLNEVIERYRGRISDGTLRSWHSMSVGHSFLKIGKAVLYPREELDRWDRRGLIVCPPFRPHLIDDVSKQRAPSSITYTHIKRASRANLRSRLRSRPFLLGVVGLDRMRQENAGAK